jgi:predicted metal-binding protein
VSDHNNEASDAKPSGPVIVSVCTTCRLAADETTRIGARMLETLRPVMQANAPDVNVRAVQCLGVCKRPATIAVSAPDGYTFVFGDLEPEGGAAAVAAFALSYSMGDYGFVPWSQRPELLRRRLVARIPSVKWSPDDGRPPDAGKQTPD